MKRIAIVYSRYGAELTGGAECYTRQIAQHLANRYEVEILTTKAIDDTTWKDWYARNVEVLQGVTVRRFSVEQLRAKDFQAFHEAYCRELEQGHRLPAKERIWLEKQGPYVPELVHYLRRHRKDYDVFLFVGYASYPTVYGLPEVSERSILIPAAKEEPALHFALTEMLLTKPRAFVFLTDEERKLVRHTVPRAEPIPCAVMGTGMDVPSVLHPDLFCRQHNITEPYLLYVGLVDETKGCPLLFHYFLEYKKRCQDKLKLVLIGKQVCRVPSDPDILSLGYLSEEEKWNGIAGAKALVLPATAAAMTRALLEYMALSVPVLVNGACDVLRGHCIKSNAGLYYRNYFEFEGAVRYLLHHPMQYMQLCANAKTYVVQNYDWNQIMSQFSTLIEQVAEKNAGRQ